MDASSQNRTALVFGASGISGWHVVRELLRYPTPTTFSRVIGLTNRPLAKEDAMFENEPRLEFFSGVDLTLPPDVVIRTLREKIPDIGDVTHAYFYAYIHGPSDGSVVEVNAKLLDTTLHALEKVSPRLEHFTLQTGAKYYGFEFSQECQLPPTPWKESLARLPQPFASRLFYYKQLDILAAYAQRATWRWSEIRPDAIIGFSPVPNPMNMALNLGVYFTLWRAIHGEGSEVPFPGTPNAYVRTNTDSPMTPTARFSIYLSLKDDEESVKKINGEAFNVGGPTRSYHERWPLMAAAFGLKGVPPVQEEPMDVGKWAREHKHVWLELEKQHGLKEGAMETTEFTFLYGLSVPIDREYDTSKMREIGYDENQDSIDFYKEAWGFMAQVKMIPPA